MTPILFDSSATVFTNNGLGKLSDVITCSVTEERNGLFECVFSYPMDGKHYSDIVEGRIIVVDHDETGDLQPFEIYRHEAPIDGITVWYAHHISYRLSNTILKPFSASSAAAALTGFETYTITENHFSYWTDKTTTGNFVLNAPASARSMLGGTTGSILDVYGGEFEFDKFTIKLHSSRGADNGVQIRYGKNLSDLKQTYDTLDLYSAIVPYWVDRETGVAVYGSVITGRGGIEYNGLWEDENHHFITDENDENFEFKYYQTRTIPMDFSDKFQDRPTVEELEAVAASYLEQNKPWIPRENITVDFVALWQTEEYANIAPLERVKLCDTVTVVYTALGVKAKAKVIKTVWNPLVGKYDSIEIGEAKTTFADTIINSTKEVIDTLPTVGMMDEAIKNATELITGGSGGHVVFGFDEDGKPNEIFVMDTEDVNTAVNVLRINVNGIGFSHNGVNGPYGTAWDLKGNFVADYITAGTLVGNRIKGGILSSLDGSSYWDLEGSKQVFYDKNFDSSVELDEGYISFKHNDTEFGKILRQINSKGDALTVAGINSLIGLQDYIYLQAGDAIWASAEKYINAAAGTYINATAKTFINADAKNSIRFNTKDDNGNISSKIRMYDDGENQFVDANSGGETWVRIEGKTDRITMAHNGISGSPILTDTGGSFNEIKKMFLQVNSQNTPFLMCESANGTTYYVTLTQM